MNEPRSTIYISVILGTAREGRRSEAVARYVHALLAKRGGIETELVDVRDFRLDATVKDDVVNPIADAWRAKAKRADGFLIVSPEYNHGYPGELKQLLDCAYAEYEHKPLAICGVSDGGMGGVRMMEQLRLVSITLGLVPIRAAVYFSKVLELFDDAGKPMNDSKEKQLAGLFDELVWYARALKAARESIQSK